MAASAHLFSSRLNRTARIAAGVVCVTLALTAPGALQAAAKKAKPAKENKRSDTKTIESMEEGWRQAMLAGDADAMDKLLDDDFVGISANGVLSDKQQYLRRMRTGATKATRIDQFTLKVRLQPTSAIVTSEARATVQLDGRQIGGIFHYTRVYGRKPGGEWKILNYEATRVSGAGAGGEMQGGRPIPTPPADTK